MYERSRNLLECHIAGFTYYDGLEVIDQLILGTIVTLKSEPENPYDPDAIAVYLGEKKLGYVPRAKGVRFGRPPPERPKAFDRLRMAWKNEEIFARYAAKQLDIVYRAFLLWANDI